MFLKAQRLLVGLLSALILFQVADLCLDRARAFAGEAEAAATPLVAEQAVVVEGYRVGPDDEIKITVYGEKDLSGAYAVNGNGFISFPLIGDVKVLNLTLAEIEEALVKGLKDGYLLDPRVSIEISKYRPFYILGEVRAPGSYAYMNNMSVLNAVAMAGGFTYRANKKNVEIMRTRAGGEAVNSEEPVETSVMPGDIILVRERFF